MNRRSDRPAKEKPRPDTRRHWPTPQPHFGLVVRLMAARAEKPDSANGLRKALRAMMRHAVDIGLRADDPTRDVKALRPKSKLGFHRWTESEIVQFEARHPIGSKPRLALALGLFTGQARLDVVAMGPQHIENEVLYWIRGKTERTTGSELSIPVHSTLRTIIDATPSGHLTLLITELGAPFSAAGFGNWFREQCDMANLRHCSFHGLRKAASVRLAEAGCTPHEMAAITGHASIKEIVRYTQTVDRKRLAAAAMDKVKSRTPSVKPDTKFDKKPENLFGSKAENEIWLPFLDTYRTMCRAPERAFRQILEDIRELRFAALGSTAHVGVGEGFGRQRPRCPQTE
jgi:integrase